MEPDYDTEYGLAQDDHYCVHGQYVGGWAGPDYMCGLCEDSAFTLCRGWQYRIAYVNRHGMTFLDEKRSTFAGLMNDDMIQIINDAEPGHGLKMVLTKYQVYYWLRDGEVTDEDEVIGAFYSRADLSEHEDAIA